MIFVPQRSGSYSPVALMEDYGQQERVCRSPAGLFVEIFPSFHEAHNG